jgi:soluble lytic murein transglycosylase
LRLSASDADELRAVLNAARTGEGPRIRAGMEAMHDPFAREIALWALTDSAPTAMSFAEADSARRDLADWPDRTRRQAAAENLLDQSGLSPQATVSWFAGAEPQTPRGALALATALNATGHASAAADLIRKAWRTEVFDQATQDAILTRFSGTLTQADHVAREDLLLYGVQTGAAEALLPLLPRDQQALAAARIAVRRGESDAEALIAALPANLRNSPGLTYERVLRLRDRDEDAAARALVVGLPDALPSQPAAEHLWRHGALALDALKTGDSLGAYAAASHSGLSVGQPAAEAQFLAGWIALTRLKDPQRADYHFARVQALGFSPLTQSRAFYWRGRAAEAAADPVGAQLFYEQAAKYFTTFYGQLAAARSGAKLINLGHDPAITREAREAFEKREPVRALRLMAMIGAKESFRAFALDMSDTVSTDAEAAQLVDITETFGDMEIALRVVRNLARHGFILPERGYPLRSPPLGPDAPETAFVLGITRQESSFNPLARSGAGARGMMQLMPATARSVARRLGLAYSSGALDNPDYNMKLGSAYLGQLVDQYSGSYVMAAAAYNAGPGRPTTWSSACGDPRGSAMDPLDFIECIPFSETRDYVMRVLEATQVYRARLHGGVAPLTLQDDLKRGAFGYH